MKLLTERCPTPVRTLIVLAGLMLASTLPAQTPLKQAYISSDIQSKVFEDASQSTVINAGDSSIFSWDAAGTNSAFAVWPDTPAVKPLDLSGLNFNPRMYAVDVAIALDGVLIEPSDVFFVDGTLTSPTIIFDGSANALPAGVNIDAVTVDPDTGDVVLSFDRSVGGSPLFRRGDLVRWTGSVYEIYFQASMLSPRADINGAHILESGNILMTFESGLSVPGESGTFYVRDDEVVEYDADAGWFYPAAVDFNVHPSWTRAGFDALAAVEGGDAIFSDRFED